MNIYFKKEDIEKLMIARERLENEKKEERNTGEKKQLIKKIDLYIETLEYVKMISIDQKEFEQIKSVFPKQNQ